MNFVPQWKVGDRVKFGHQLRDPSATVYRVMRRCGTDRDSMIEIDKLPGEFAPHLFVAADYPADSIVPRPGAA